MTRRTDVNERLDIADRHRHAWGTCRGDMMGMQWVRHDRLRHDDFGMIGSDMTGPDMTGLDMIDVDMMGPDMTGLDMMT